MKYVWEDLPERKNCFTVRNASMINLNTGKIVRQYVANTRISVVQKCNITGKTYYRTSEAAHHYLNYAFEASAFGLPNELAPSELSSTSNSPKGISPNEKPATRTLQPNKKQTSVQKVVSPKDGEAARRWSWIKRLLRRNKK